MNGFFRFRFAGSSARFVLAAALAISSLASGGAAKAQIMYQVIDIPVENPPVNFRVTDLTLPLKIKLEWDYGDMSSLVTPGFEVKRNGVAISGGQIGGHYYMWDNDPGSPFDTTIQYSVRCSYDHEDLGLPGPPPGADPNTIAHLHYNT